MAGLRTMSSSATLSGVAKRKDGEKTAGPTQRSRTKENSKFQIFLLCVRPVPAPENDSTNDLDLLLDDDQGKLT